MRILLENSSSSFLNHGDTAMLIIAVDRLRKFWPEASIRVITSQPDRLGSNSPEAEPIVIRYPPWWRWLGGAARRVAPSGTRRFRSMLEVEIKRRWPARYKRILRKAVAEADIVVHSGAGVFSDVFEAEAIRRLQLLKEATQAGKPTALFSQGIGPLNRPSLHALAGSVFPYVDFIGLRESLSSLALLLELGANPSRVVTTGDDAIALAYLARKSDPGDQIGVNLRMTGYAQLSARDTDLLASIRRALRAAEVRYGASLTPIPMAQGDGRSIDAVLSHRDPSSPGREDIGTVYQILERINRCRVVVTGSYHAAVFALAQGIAAVCLARSTYYRQKFRGLADLFGAGCEVVLLEDSKMREKLTAAIDRCWRLSSELSPQLLEAAERQIEASREAYRAFYALAQARIAAAADVAKR